MPSGFKFIHASDVHLDSPLRGLARYDGAPDKLLRGATRRALSNLVQRALDEQVAFVVLAGDLYDGDWRDFNTGLFLVSQLARLRDAGVRAYILKGNHDAESQITQSLPLPDNVKVFSTRKAETFTDGPTGAALHGRSFREAKTEENLVIGYPRAEAGRFNVGVLHTALEGRAEHVRYAPCTEQDLKACGYDYWALGHVHAFEVVSRDPWIVFAGNLQGRHARETGPRGAVVVTVEDGRVAAVEHVALDAVRWIHLRVDVGGSESMGAVEQRVRAELERACETQADGRMLAARLTLHGATLAHASLVSLEAELRANLRAIASGLGGDGVWLEKIQVATAVPGAAAPGAPRREVAEDLAQLLADTAEDAELRSALASELEALVGRLPRDERLGEDAMLESIRAGAGGPVMDRALPLLLDRIARGGAGGSER